MKKLFLMICVREEAFSAKTERKDLGCVTESCIAKQFLPQTAQKSSHLCPTLINLVNDAHVFIIEERAMHRFQECNDFFLSPGTWGYPKMQASLCAHFRWP
mmetsp:Transcript_33165/g.47079  ORF Transcript_33165/g.47079 Transcript_33165/m.47079 type:complete len:101 (-) Transcript_33165:894-1196(-)